METRPVRWMAAVCLLFLVFPVTVAATPAEPVSQDPATVQTFQAALILLGYDPGPIDGILGPLTAAALRFFQLDHDLEPTGAPDRPTLLAIRDDLEVFSGIEALKDVGRRLMADPGPVVGR